VDWIETPSDYNRHQEYVDEIIEPLQELEQRGHPRYDVFRDWLKLQEEALQRNDEAYLEIVEQYEDDREEGSRNIDLFTEATGKLWNGLEETGADLLGVVYETLGHDSDAFGQYFTPHNVSRAKTEMVIGTDSFDDVDEPVRIGDPACGSGRLLLLAAQTLPEDVDAFFYGQDKDPVCAKMTALNLTYYNMDGLAVHGDSLTMDVYNVWETRGSPMGGELRRLPESEWPDFEDMFATADSEDQEDEDVDEVDAGTGENPDLDLEVDELESSELSDFIED
jgi:type I restriction-modification system DNA methylase subunit